MRISRFLGHNALVNMIFFVFIIFVLQTPAVANGNEDKLAELSSKEEELVRWASYGEEKLSTVVISGKLLCHSAAKDKLSSHPHPVSGASVAVFCGTSGRKKKSWARGSTSSYGEFLIDLPSHLHAIPNLEKICLVKVLHLPKSSPCRRAFSGKHKAIKLTSIGEGVRIYTTQKIHLLPKPSQEHMRQGGKTEQAISIL